MYDIDAAVELGAVTLTEFELYTEEVIEAVQRLEKTVLLSKNGRIIAYIRPLTEEMLEQERQEVIASGTEDLVALIQIASGRDR